MSFSASSPRSRRSPIAMKRANSQARSWVRFGLAPEWARIGRTAGIRRPCSQPRKRPGRVLRSDTLDARSFIVDACVADTNTAALRNVYANAQHIEHRQLREIARQTVALGRWQRKGNQER